ncbi:MAG TPA: adenylate/guanylate cyclase domain-containing protein, partial [Candidatus Sumerlaeota bacterium]|nr:adenylate/guanylate cyclase domain-containing protein [Candidatus Sumerlaeota bacterium]
RNDAFLALDDDLVRNLDRRQNLLRRKLRQIGTAWLNMNYALRDIEPPDAPVPHAVSAVFPTEILMTGATGIGFINVMKTREGTVRRIPMFIRWNGTIYPHLDLVFVCDYYGIRPSDLKVRFGEFIEFTPRRNASGIRRIPIDREGFITVNFRRSSFHDGPLPTGSSYTMHQVLHYGRHGADAPTRIRPERFKNAVVVVGELTPGGTDVHPTPIAPAYPLVGIHAAIIGMILKNDYIQEPPLWFTLAAIMLAGLSAGLLFGLMEYRPAILAALLIALSYLAVSVILFNRQSLFLPIVRPAGTLILASLFLIIYILGVKEGERRKVRSIFLKTVSPRIGEQILRDFDNVAIWGTRKIVTIMFVDIRGFTSLAESLSPMELVDLLNVYYDTVSDIIFRHDGVVNKFIGDAVMSLFGAPLDLDNAEVRALRAAVEIQEALRTLEVPPLPDGTRRSFGVGIGISSGEVVVGTVGRRKIRIEYTALGDTVNIAERLQGIAPAGDILAGAAVRERALAKQDAFMKERSVVFEPHAPVALKGKEKPVEIFRVSWT